MSDVKVRDLRTGFYWINNCILDEYAAKLGINAYAVYTALTRFANNDTSQCNPSRATIAEKLGVSTDTIDRALVKLVKAKLIEVEKVKKGDLFLHNLYTLLGVGVAANGGHPSRKQRPPVAAISGTNNTKNKKTKTTAAPVVADERHDRIRKFIGDCYENLCNIKAPWSGAEARMLAEVLKNNPSWTVDQMRRMIWNRFRSENHPRSAPPRQWLNTISSYLEGPLNKFGRPFDPPPPVITNKQSDDVVASIRERREAKRAAVN